MEIDIAELRIAFRNIERLRRGEEEESDVYPDGQGRGFDESHDESTLLDAVLFIGEEAFIRLARRRLSKEQQR